MNATTSTPAQSTGVQLIKISHDTEIPLILYKGQPVLTFSLIDKVHGRPEGTARRNFSANKDKFIPEEDYFQLMQADMEAMDEFRTSMNPKGILLITESGYLMLVKSFTDDLAWQVQRQLVKVYFRAKQEAQATQPAPAEAPELFSSADQQNLQRLVWLITHRFHFKHAFVQAVWYALRAITGNPSPNRFQVNHIPPLAAELRRIFAITGTLSEAISEAEGMVIKRILRHGENAEKVLAEAKAMLLKAAGEEATELNVCLSRWDEHEIAQFVTRDRRGHGSSYADVQEKLFQ